MIQTDTADLCISESFVTVNATNHYFNIKTISLSKTGDQLLLLLLQQAYILPLAFSGISCLFNSLIVWSDQSLLSKLK